MRWLALPSLGALGRTQSIDLRFDVMPGASLLIETISKRSHKGFSSLFAPVIGRDDITIFKNLLIDESTYALPACWWNNIRAEDCKELSLTIENRRNAPDESHWRSELPSPTDVEPEAKAYLHSLNPASI